MFNVTPCELTCVALVMCGPSQSHLTNIEGEGGGENKNRKVTISVKFPTRVTLKRKPHPGLSDKVGEYLTTSQGYTV